jgi:hypothetical protein
MTTNQASNGFTSAKPSLTYFYNPNAKPEPMSQSARMKSTPPQGQTRAKALTHDDLSARFRDLEDKLQAFKESLLDESAVLATEEGEVTQHEPEPEPKRDFTRQENVDRLRTLLDLGAAMTVKEAAAALEVGNKTAYRLFTDAAFPNKFNDHKPFAFLYFEPFKNTLRLRAVNINRFLVDAKLK